MGSLETIKDYLSVIVFETMQYLWIFFKFNWMEIQFNKNRPTILTNTTRERRYIKIQNLKRVLRIRIGAWMLPRWSYDKPTFPTYKHIYSRKWSLAKRKPSESSISEDRQKRSLVGSNGFVTDITVSNYLLSDVGKSNIQTRSFSSYSPP